MAIDFIVGPHFSRQFIRVPPLTLRDCPVKLKASSDAKNATAFPMSSGIYSRLKGTSVRNCLLEYLATGKARFLGVVTSVTFRYSLLHGAHIPFWEMGQKSRTHRPSDRRRG
jgi:hypothetical protein